MRANKILLFIKGTRASPQCGFSSIAIKILEETGCEFEVGSRCDSSSKLIQLSHVVLELETGLLGPEEFVFTSILYTPAFFLRRAVLQVFDVLSDAAVRAGVKAFSDWPTIPQLFVDGEFIGGCV